MSEKSAAQKIQDAAVISQFLGNDVIREMLGALKLEYYEEFLASESSEARVRAWSKGRVLKDFGDAMQSVLDAGEMEVIVAAKATSSRSFKE